MAELPWVHVHAAKDVLAGRGPPWAIFGSARALGAVISLLDTFRNRRVLWRFSPRIIYCVRSLGPANMCSGADGPSGETTAYLETFLDREDQFPDTEAFRQGLRDRSADRRDR